MKTIQFECSLDIHKAYEEKDRWIVEGMAATSDFDLQEDIISQQAIEESAKDLLGNSTVLHNHNPNESIGKVERSQARKGGLWLKIFVSKTAPEIWQKIKEGVLNKFSIRGKILEAKKQWITHLKRFARVILKMHLLEVSLVAVPANPKAKAIRWYIEKALDEFESEGGEIEEMSDQELYDLTLEKGGIVMQKDNGIVEEELLEASGEPDLTGNDGDAAKGFPPAEQLWKEWQEHCENNGIAEKSQQDVWDAWVAFCKQQGYPSPAPYPYPQPQRGTRMNQIVQLVDKLLKDEQDDERKKVLSQIREIARGATYANPSPQGKKDDEPGSVDDDAQKAGRKVSKSRLEKLKKLLEELQHIISEVDPKQGDEKQDNTAGNDDALSKKLDSVESTIGKIIKTLGLHEAEGDEEGKEKDVNLVEVIQGLSKRLEAIEGIPAVKTSIDGQEDLADSDKDTSLWKGLI